MLRSVRQHNSVRYRTVFTRLNDLFTSVQLTQSFLLFAVRRPGVRWPPSGY